MYSFFLYNIHSFVLLIDMYRHFNILSKRTKEYRRFNAVGTQLTVRLNPPTDNDTNPMTHFLTSVNELFQYALQNFNDSDMVGITIRNEVNQQEKAICFSFRQKDQIYGDVMWRVFEKVSQSNARFNALNKLVIYVHSVKMPVGFGRGIISKGRSLSVLVYLKKSIVEVKAENNCLAHALIIAVAKLTNDPNYNSYRRGRKVLPQVRHLLQKTGISLDRGAGIPELARFQEHFSEYCIVVYEGLNCDQIIYDGQVDLPKRINLLYDGVTRHYHVINNLTGAMAKKYVFKACNTGCERDVTHICDQTCSDCMASPPCISTGVRIPCDGCNRHFRNQTCFDNNKKQTEGKQKSPYVCERSVVSRVGSLSRENTTYVRDATVKYAVKTEK
jgi:hypothetical protein